MNDFFRRFPVRVALVALLFYGLTLSWGVTMNSLGFTAQVAGWDWQPMVGRPVLWLLTLPIRMLPGGWVAVAVNFFSAVCAAATLGMLARSLELMPWMVPLENVSGWQRRLPVWLGVAVCGLQFSFWQGATAATGDMLDVLLPAAAMWCVLEFRTDKNPRWLRVAAVIWGAGMAENWVMVVCLPLFIGGLIWLRRMRFFRLDFILPVAGLMLAGFCVYALLPLANGLRSGSPWSLGEAWTASWRETSLLAHDIHNFWRFRHLLVVAVLLFYSLPVIGCVARLRDEDPKNKSDSERFQIWILRGLRTALLFICVWLAFDPLAGLRQIMADQLKVNLALLSLDYLIGLGVGFMAGNLLLMKPEGALRRSRRFSRQIEQWAEQAAVPVVTALLALTVAGLLVRNMPEILAANRQPLTQLGDLALRSLPPGGGVVLSDLSDGALLFQAAQARHADKAGWLAVDVQALPAPDYRAHLDRERPGLWLVTTNRHVLAPREMALMLDRLSHTNRIFYLHPSFGYFFENFYLEPAGAIYEFKEFTNEIVNAPAVTMGEIANSEKIWDTAAPRIDALAREISVRDIFAVRWMNQALRLGDVDARQERMVAEWYSMSLDGWGVELQRSGDLSAAERCFTQASALNTNNWIARLNLYCNTNLQAHATLDLSLASSLASHVGDPKNLGANLSRYGPIDEPGGCYLLGTVYEGESAPREALQEFERARTLAPGGLLSWLALANLYLECRMTDATMQTISQVRVKFTYAATNSVVDVGLSLLEADVWRQETNAANFRKTLNGIVKKYPQDPSAANRVAQAYLGANDLVDAGRVIINGLMLVPDSRVLLLAQSSVFIRSGQPAAAIPVLDHLLTLTNLPEAKFNRAQAYLLASNYPAAQADFMELYNLTTNSVIVNLGLGDVAARQQDIDLAMQYYRFCLSNTPAGSPQWNTVSERVKALTQKK